MIPQNEVGEKAREYGVPVSTIERDYAQNWLLRYLSQINMVLKGGTGIRKTYIENYRFSDDLDFTLLKTIEKGKLKDLVEDAVINAREESGINFSENIVFNENENGFEIAIYFQIMQTGKSRTRIKIDITKFEQEKILLSINKKRIIHPYSDKLEAEIHAYSLEEIMAEKIRSLFQRTRPRDLYDVWYLWDKIDKKLVFNIIYEKFRIKDVDINLKDFEQRKDDFRNAWESSLKHQLKELPDFEKVFESVGKEVEKYSLR